MECVDHVNLARAVQPALVVTASFSRTVLDALGQVVGGVHRQAVARLPRRAVVRAHDREASGRLAGQRLDTL